MLNLSEIFPFGMKLRIYYRYCLNIVCGRGVIRLFVCMCIDMRVYGGRVPTYNRNWLPGKAQSAPDANIFTAAAC